MQSATTTHAVQPTAVPERQSHPIAPDGAGRAPAPEPRVHVLVVDDEPAQQLLSQVQLKKLGCDATVVSSGEAALQLFSSTKQQSRPSPFDLVLMDMVMPGLDGMAASKAIRDLYPGQNIVIASGYAPGAQAEEAGRLGLLWLVKPYTITALADAIRTARNRIPGASPVPLSP